MTFTLAYSRGSGDQSFQKDIAKGIRKLVMSTHYGHESIFTLDIILSHPALPMISSTT